MLEIAGLLARSSLLGQGEVGAALWFGAGLIVGLVVAVASLAACALECLTPRHAS
jgi:hypothetical protein